MYLIVLYTDFIKNDSSRTSALKLTLVFGWLSTVLELLAETVLTEKTPAKKRERVW